MNRADQIDPPGPERRLQIVTTCKSRDLPILTITIRKLWEMTPCRAVFIIAPVRDCAPIQKKIGALGTVVPEDTFIPSMTIAQLKRLDAPGFPRAAGWYFQQFLKLQFANSELAEDYYLIWDADTVPLRPMHFFDADGKMLLTQADEYHAPYFITYRNLFGSDPQREFSLIAQHMVVQRNIAREMLALIQQRVAGTDDWPWKIMRALPRTGNNLFSEYETYGHYLKNYHPDRVRFIRRNWRRTENIEAGCALPTPAELAMLARTFDYAAFERAGGVWQRWGRRWARNFRSIYHRG